MKLIYDSETKVLASKVKKNQIKIYDFYIYSECELELHNKVKVLWG